MSVSALPVPSRSFRASDCSPYHSLTFVYHSSSPRPSLPVVEASHALANRLRVLWLNDEAKDPPGVDLEETLSGRGHAGGGQPQRFLRAENQERNLEERKEEVCFHTPTREGEKEAVMKEEEEERGHKARGRQRRKGRSNRQEITLYPNC
eukprot:761057-Hanusia_phi.AAC.3